MNESPSLPNPEGKFLDIAFRMLEKAFPANDLISAHIPQDRTDRKHHMIEKIPPSLQMRLGEEKDSFQIPVIFYYYEPFPNTAGKVYTVALTFKFNRKVEDSDTRYFEYLADQNIQRCIFIDVIDLFEITEHDFPKPASECASKILKLGNDFNFEKEIYYDHFKNNDEDISFEEGITEAHEEQSSQYREYASRIYVLKEISDINALKLLNLVAS
ncbi:MAG TPA: hypothetical protein VGA67_02885 [Candidatus Dojkabacteria bacterium]